MSDRQRLEEALRWLIDRSKPSAECVQFVPVLEQAIRAHLATLPKPIKKWGVGVGGGWVHFDSFDAAMDALRQEAKAGWTVTIELREVPA